MLLADQAPVYLTARLTGGGSFSAQIAEAPTWSPASKIAARYLAPYLDGLDRETGHSPPTLTAPGPIEQAADPRTAIAASVAST
jgi:hypothetical protein